MKIVRTPEGGWEAEITLASHIGGTTETLPLEADVYRLQWERASWYGYRLKGRGTATTSARMTMERHTTTLTRHSGRREQ